MAASLTGLPCVRRVAVGLSSAPQGADGVSELTRTAYAALLAAPWAISDDPPTIPVHEFDRSVPSGDAFCATWGYSENDRTEQAAAGAVCYTFRIPADALTGEACSITSFSASVVGDRYLNAGAQVRAIASASAEPPSVSQFFAAGVAASSVVCATSDQENDNYNKRTGETETANVSLSVSATAYLHVALFCADYLAHRGAWIEGGAMLVCNNASVVFSRSVEPDAAATLDLEIGLEASGKSAANRWGVVPAPRADLSFSGLPYIAPDGTLAEASAYADPRFEAMALLRVADASFVVSPAQGQLTWNAYGNLHGLFSQVSLALEDDKTYVRPSIRVVVRSGFGTGAYRALSISPSISASAPLDVAVYALAAPCDCATPGPQILSSAFWNGKLSSMNAVTAPLNSASDVAAVYDHGTNAGAVAATAQIGVVPLAHIAIPAGSTLSHILFDAPLDVTGIATILLAIAPSAIMPPSSLTASTTIPVSTTLTLVP